MVGARFACSVSWTSDLEHAAGRLRDVGRDRIAVLVVDSRAFDGRPAGDALAVLLRSLRDSSVIYYSSSLDSPGFDSLIRETPGAIRVDKRRRRWPRFLLQTVDVCLARRLFFEVFRMLQEGVPADSYPVAPSITSEILLLTSLIREFPSILDERTKSIGGVLFDLDPANLRFGSTPMIRMAADGDGGRMFAKDLQIRSFGEFDVRFWSKSRSYAECAARAGGLLHQSYAALSSSGAPRRFRVWILDPSHYQGPSLLKGLYQNLPFIDSTDDGITLAIRYSDPKPTLTELELLKTKLQHEGMHIVNRVRKPRIPPQWVWFDEAMANWHARRGDAGGHRPRIPACTALNRVHNRFAGLYFLEFLEEQYGAGFIRRVWGTDAPDVFSAFVHLGADRDSLLVEFYNWAGGQDLLESSAVRVAAMPATAYCLLPVAGRQVVVNTAGDQVRCVLWSHGCHPASYLCRDRVSIGLNGTPATLCIVNAASGARNQFSMVRVTSAE